MIDPEQLLKISASAFPEAVDHDIGVNTAMSGCSHVSLKSSTTIFDSTCNGAVGSCCGYDQGGTLRGRGRETAGTPNLLVYASFFVDAVFDVFRF